jgi:hypothetical protein
MADRIISEPWDDPDPKTGVRKMRTRNMDQEQRREIHRNLDYYARGADLRAPEPPASKKGSYTVPEMSKGGKVIKSWGK